MLENSAIAASVKRYAPPHHKNRTHNRRNSGGERVDRTNSFGGSDVDKNYAVAPRNIPSTGHGEAGGGSNLNDNARLGLIALDGCWNSEAKQLLNKRWEATMHCYNSPATDLSERPVMYSGSNAAAWGNFRLPHQIIHPTPSINLAPPGPPQMDFPGPPRPRFPFVLPRG